ncbi:(d)CMP kinase [Microterricola viridarii]|uniref:Cytidylate kinase n=1 Tax=Microterricola viridarii TaxID=412690 RepID=A0A1H1WSB4_9MICO|nr:(d)CMP kinase [Microterricola viridarii]SDS99935.1 cytidylate kinase [Microterricola viridarii]
MTTPDSAQTIVVAIDGPAGSGKSSVSKAVARALGYGYLDTGAAYRALAWLVLEKGVDSEDADAVIAALDDFDYFIATNPDEYVVRVGETDVTEAIREPRVSAAVSAIARVPAVRSHLVELFRSIAAGVDAPGVVVEGRDITTVVAPDAPVRILLTASEEARMARRSAELQDDAAATAGAELKKRDQADSRVVDFLNAAEGVTTVDSTELNFAETVDAVITVIADTQSPVS